MTRHIIVGVDGSRTATKAARRAAHIAVQSDSTLVVMTAFDKVTKKRIEINQDAWVITSADEAEAQAATVARSLAVPGVKIEVVAMRGKPAEALVAEARRRKAELIVVGNRRVQGMSRLLGSVASAVAKNAPCDVQIVKTV